VLFHPTFLYESIWSLAGVALLLAADKKFNLRWGKMMGLYLVYYSIGRVWIEAIRIDPSEIFLGLRVNIWSAIAGIALGLAIILIQSRRHPGLEDSVYKPGRAPAVSTPVVEQVPQAEVQDRETDASNDEGNKLVSDK
jgi:prolipoprotein diacylglyceryltransferase